MLGVSTASVAGTTNYTYDELGRLTNVAAPADATNFSYDPAGNRTSETVGLVAPTAETDNIATSVSTPVTYDPRTNDRANGVSITVTSIGPPAHGTAVIGAGGTSITYTPTAGYTGADLFHYGITNSLGAHDVGTVNITVTP
jgi:YD repeat-containing protein